LAEFTIHKSLCSVAVSKSAACKPIGTISFTEFSNLCAAKLFKSLPSVKGPTSPKETCGLVIAFAKCTSAPREVYSFVFAKQLRSFNVHLLLNCIREAVALVAHFGNCSLDAILPFNQNLGWSTLFVLTLAKEMFEVVFDCDAIVVVVVVCTKLSSPNEILSST
jgi:hypothetical protein